MSTQASVEPGSDSIRDIVKRSMAKQHASPRKGTSCCGPASSCGPSDSGKRMSSPLTCTAMPKPRRCPRPPCWRRWDVAIRLRWPS